MDFDLIDAAGTAVIFSDGGKPAVLTMPGGGLYPMNIFIDRETLVSPTDFDNFSAEQRIVISADLDKLPNRTRAPKGSMFVAGGKRYVVDDDDSQSTEDASVATHVVRML